MDTRSVDFPTISESDLAGKLVSELDDKPQMLPSELKARFDALSKEVIIPAFNTLSQNTEQISERLVASDGTPFRFGVTEDGKFGYIVTDEEGADTVVPFSTGGDASALYEALQYSGLVTEDMTFEEMCEVLANEYPAIYKLYMSTANEGNFEAYNGSDASASYGTGLPSVTFATAIKFSASKDNGTLGSSVISELIDLTRFKKIKLRHSSTITATYGADTFCYVSLFITSSKAQYMGSNIVASKKLVVGEAGTFENDAELDISAVEGEYYIGICCHTNHGTTTTEISNMYME